MAKLNNYSGSIDLISGLRPKNNGAFPLLTAHDVQVDENGKRLDTKLEELAETAEDINPDNIKAEIKSYVDDAILGGVW